MKKTLLKSLFLGLMSCTFIACYNNNVVDDLVDGLKETKQIVSEQQEKVFNFPYSSTLEVNVSLEGTTKAFMQNLSDGFAPKIHWQEGTTNAFCFIAEQEPGKAPIAWASGISENVAVTLGDPNNPEGTARMETLKFKMQTLTTSQKPNATYYIMVIVGGEPVYVTTNGVQILQSVYYSGASEAIAFDPSAGQNNQTKQSFSLLFASQWTRKTNGRYVVTLNPQGSLYTFKLDTNIDNPEENMIIGSNGINAINVQSNALSSSGKFDLNAISTATESLDNTSLSWTPDSFGYKMNKDFTLKSNGKKWSSVSNGVSTFGGRFVIWAMADEKQTNQEMSARLIHIVKNPDLKPDTLGEKFIKTRKVNGRNVTPLLKNGVTLSIPLHLNSDLIIQELYYSYQQDREVSDNYDFVNYSALLIRNPTNTPIDLTNYGLMRVHYHEEFINYSKHGFKFYHPQVVHQDINQSGIGRNNAQVLDFAKIKACITGENNTSEWKRTTEYTRNYAGLPITYPDNNAQYGRTYAIQYGPDFAPSGSNRRKSDNFTGILAPGKSIILTGPYICHANGGYFERTNAGKPYPQFMTTSLRRMDGSRPYDLQYGGYGYISNSEFTKHYGADIQWVIAVDDRAQMQDGGNWIRDNYKVPKPTDSYSATLNLLPGDGVFLLKRNKSSWETADVVGVDTGLWYKINSTNNNVWFPLYDLTNSQNVASQFDTVDAWINGRAIDTRFYKRLGKPNFSFLYRAYVSRKSPFTRPSKVFVWNNWKTYYHINADGSTSTRDNFIDKDNYRNPVENYFGKASIP